MWCMPCMSVSVLWIHSMRSLILTRFLFAELQLCVWQSIFKQRGRNWDRSLSLHPVQLPYCEPEHDSTAVQNRLCKSELHSGRAYESSDLRAYGGFHTINNIIIYRNRGEITSNKKFILGYSDIQLKPKTFPYLQKCKTSQVRGGASDFWEMLYLTISVMLTHLNTNSTDCVNRKIKGACFFFMCIYSNI